MRDVAAHLTMHQLTILATVFLPLTLVTGSFGQNFGWLVRRLDGPGAFVAYGIGSLAVPLALLAVRLRFRTPHTSTAPGADDHGPGFRAEPRRRTSRPL